jgi:hypothetical protein
MYQQQTNPLNSLQYNRLVAGIWFAVAAVIPTIIFLRVFWPATSGRSLYDAVLLVGPLLTGGISGSAIGVHILNPKRVATGTGAIGRGVLVALFAFILYMLLVGLVTSVTAGPFSFELSMIGPFIVLLYGTVVAIQTAGWVMLLTGAVAGWLLYFFRGRLAT